MAKQLELSFSSKFKKQYKKLPKRTQTKFTTQLKILQENYRYPSLRTKKIAGKNIFEARIDIHNRFTFETIDEFVILLTIGPHDTGLGKK